MCTKSMTSVCALYDTKRCLCVCVCVCVCHRVHEHVCVCVCATRCMVHVYVHVHAHVHVHSVIFAILFITQEDVVRLSFFAHTAFFHEPQLPLLPPCWAHGPLLL